MAGTTTVTQMQFSYPQTDQTDFQNLLAFCSQAKIKGFIFHEETAVDVASLGDAAGASQSITVPGAALGDMVIGVSLGVSSAGITVTANVTAANTVIVRFQNESAGTVDLASTTVKLWIADTT